MIDDLFEHVLELGTEHGAEDLLGNRRGGAGCRGGGRCAYRRVSVHLVVSHLVNHSQLPM